MLRWYSEPLRWWNRDIAAMKLQVRLRERIWRRSKTDHDRLSYTEMRYRYCRSLAATKAEFYSSEIESASNDNRSMFRIANQLLGRERQKQNFPHHCNGPTAVANHFAHHFADKIDSIHSQLQKPPDAVTSAHPCSVAAIVSTGVARRRNYTHPKWKDKIIEDRSDANYSLEGKHIRLSADLRGTYKSFIQGLYCSGTLLCLNCTVVILYRLLTTCCDRV